jgi:hypothetical protein
LRSPQNPSHLAPTGADACRSGAPYGRFVDLGKEADPELQPVVQDVRARIARLAGEHRDVTLPDCSIRAQAVVCSHAATQRLAP